MALVFLNATAQDNGHFTHLNKKFRSFSESAGDSNGFIWITDLDGLYRYNGYDFKFIDYNAIFGEHFKERKPVHLKKDSQNRIWVITDNGKIARIDSLGLIQELKIPDISGKLSTIESSKDDLFVGDQNGTVYRFNKEQNICYPIFTLPNFAGKTQAVQDIIIENQNIWVSSSAAKIYRYHLTNESLTEIEFEFSGDKMEYVQMVMDHQRKLWIATAFHGLVSYDVETKGLRKFGKNDEDRYVLFRTIFKDANGTIWAGSDGAGLFQYNTKAGVTKNYTAKNQNPYTLSNNTIRNISEDKNGNLLIIAKDGFLDILTKDKSTIEYIPGLPDNFPTRILSIFKSRDGNLYVGTDGEGLTIITPSGIKNYNPHLENAPAYIQSISEDRNGKIWIGTYLNGLYIFDPENQKFQKITKGLEGIKDVRTVFVDSNNRIWTGSSAGIRIYNQEQELIYSLNFDEQGLKGVIIDAIIEAENHSIWIGSSYNLLKFQENKEILEKSSFKTVAYFPEHKAPLYNFSISEMELDGFGNLYLRIDSGLLIQLNLATLEYQILDDNASLGDLEIISMEFETANSMWLTATKGIYRYDFSNKNLKSFYQDKEQQAFSFTRRASYKSDDGKIYFGGANGLLSFFPENMASVEKEATLFIDQIEVLNTDARKIIPEQLKDGYQNLKTLKLNAEQSSFSFSFFAIGDILNSNFTYEYKLVDFNDRWIKAGNNLSASYTNIPHGDYILRIRAIRNSDNKVLDTKSVQIKIAPFWWESTLAYCLYALLILGLVFGLYKWYRLKKQLFREEVKHEKEKEIYAAKMNFFAKMSHEIQTPLTLILAPLSDMLQKTEKEDGLLNQRLRQIKHNAEKLSRIAKDLTTIRNKSIKRLRLYVTKNDLRRDLYKIVIGFNELATLKNIDFQIEIPEQQINFWYDVSNLEHVLYNVLSNAFKFTPIGGKIILRVKILANGIRISVVDNGPGIAAEDQESIFKMFFQSKQGEKIQGLGIGLALSKEIIDLHDGELSVSSQEGKGANFSIFLKNGKAHYKNRKNVSFEKIDKNSVFKPEVLSSIDKRKQLPSLLNTDKKIHILLVEDNIEMQIFLQDILSRNYKITTAKHGKKALDLLANGLSPDLIISDVMMPEMDGIEMSEKIIKNKRFNHIPIIMLTARADNASRLIGLKTGVVSYIQKPFDPAELFLTIENLVIHNQNIVCRYKIQNATNTKMDHSKNKDVEFIDQLSTCLQENIDNPSFKLEDLTKKLSMSYSVIFRKCQELTGKSLTEYFRLIKLKKAAGFIVLNNFRVSDAAFQSGYSDTKYFSKCFKEEFGMTPSQFKKEIDDNKLKEFLKAY